LKQKRRLNRDDKAVDMLNQIKGFMLDESGLETVEWAIVGGLIVAIGASFFVLIGGHASVGFTSLQNATSKIK
jgi:pilus assembly protein Flp/PilA